MSIHLTQEQKDALFVEFLNAIKAAVFPLLERERLKEICPGCAGKPLVAALAEECGSFGAIVAGNEGSDMTQQQFLVSMLVQSAFAGEVLRRGGGTAADALASMPVSGKPS